MNTTESPHTIGMHGMQSCPDWESYLKAMVLNKNEISKDTLPRIYRPLTFPICKQGGHYGERGL